MYFIDYFLIMSSNVKMGGKKKTKIVLLVLKIRRHGKKGGRNGSLARPSVATSGEFAHEERTSALARE
jgi:hypothetical protein